MGNTANNLSERCMNWTKLKSSIIVIGSVLLLNCPGPGFTRQICDQTKNTPDTLTHQSAETIIKIVYRHLPEYHPSYFDSYSAISFQKFHIKKISPSITGVLTTDTTEGLANQDKNKFNFSSETLNVHKLLKPGFNQSENLSSKSEGKDDGSFAELSVQMQEITLLNPIINILNKSYLSPFSQSAPGNYAFSTVDTISASGDSLYKINFHPKLDKRFDGFSGTAIIDVKNYAIRQISAKSTQNDPQEPLLTINQNFEQINGVWLPSGRIISVFFNRKNNGNQPDHKEDNFVAESIINIYQQQINPKLSPDDFKTAVQPALKNAPKQARSPDNYIYFPINQKDSLAKLRADSAIMADNQIKQTKLIRFVAEGKIPLGYFTLDYNRIIGYNLFEGLKLGVGGETNRLLSKHFTVGGYISYGLKDQSLRHSEWINFYPSSSKDLRVYLGYRDMNIEFGEPEFLETKSLLNPEAYRYLLIKNMYSSKRYATGLEGRPFNDLSYYAFGDLSENHSRQNTQFLIEHPFNPISLTRAGLQLRYTPGIVLQMEDGRHKEMKVAKSDYYLTIIQGLTVLGGEYHYTKIELKGKFNLPFSRFGTTTIVFRGGTMSQNSPIIELFNSYGSFAGTFSLSAPYSFATMKLNEFAAANYTAIHFRHDFSTWLFPGTMQKRPAIIFAQNIGIGQLDDTYLTQFNLKDYRKGFYESGFEVNNLLRMNYLSWGVGIYYRYGPYQFSSIHENFAYKFGFFFKL